MSGNSREVGAEEGKNENESADYDSESESEAHFDDGIRHKFPSNPNTKTDGEDEFWIQKSNYSKGNGVNVPSSLMGLDFVRAFRSHLERPDFFYTFLLFWKRMERHQKEEENLNRNMKRPKSFRQMKVMMKPLTKASPAFANILKAKSLHEKTRAGLPGTRDPSLPENALKV